MAGAATLVALRQQTPVRPAAQVRLAPRGCSARPS